MMLLPFISVVIVNYNGQRFLENCLSSVLAVDYPSECYEVILVDNASKDGSVAFVKQKFPRVRILELDKNYGFTGGNNKGARFGKGETIVFLNNDTVVDRQWLRQLVWVMEREDFAICGSRVFYLAQPDAIQYAGGYLHLIGGAVFPPFHNDQTFKQYYSVSTVCGASFAIRRDAFEDLDGFDDDFFIYAEEGDLCLRALICGYKIAYAPNSIVYHNAGGSGQSDGCFQKLPNDVAESRLLSYLTVYYGNRNSLVLLIKNFQIRNVLYGLLFSYLYLVFQLCILLKRKRSEVKLLISASVWSLQNLRSILQKRFLVQKKRKVSDSQLVKSGLILTIAQTLKIRSEQKKTSEN
jgi:GT2 family glycosyltransferase